MPTLVISTETQIYTLRQRESILPINYIVLSRFLLARLI